MPASEDAEMVRLLITDVATDLSKRVLSDDQLERLLAFYRGNVKRAAAQAMDMIASSEALAGKVIRTAAGTTTDAAKLADSLRKHAVSLRAEADADDEREDDGYFEVVDVVGGPHHPPELTGWPW